MLWFVTTVRLNLINWHPCTYLLIGARDDGSNRLPSLSCHWSGALEPPSPRQSGTIKCCPKTELGSFKSDLDRRHRQPGTSCVSRNSWLITIRPPTAAERALLRVWSRKENACLAIQINDSTDWGRGGGSRYHNTALSGGHGLFTPMVINRWGSISDPGCRQFPKTVALYRKLQERETPTPITTCRFRSAYGCQFWLQERFVTVWRKQMGRYRTDRQVMTPSHLIIWRNLI